MIVPTYGVVIDAPWVAAIIHFAGSPDPCDRVDDEWRSDLPDGLGPRVDPAVLPGAGLMIDIRDGLPRYQKVIDDLTVRLDPLPADEERRNQLVIWAHYDADSWADAVTRAERIIDAVDLGGVGYRMVDGSVEVSPPSYAGGTRYMAVIHYRPADWTNI